VLIQCSFICLQQVEKKVNEEVKAIEQDGVTSSKESVEEEKPKVEESPSPATPISKPEEMSEDKQIEPPIADVEKTDDAPVSDVPVEDNEEEKDNIPDSHTPVVPQPVDDTIKAQSEEQPAVEYVVKEAPEQVAVASLEKGQEEKANIVDVPEQIPETPEKLEGLLDVLHAKESEVVGIEEIKSSHVEKPEAAAIEAEEKPREQSVFFEQVEKAYEEVGTKERVEKANTVEVPEHITETPEKLEGPLDVLPAKESEIVGVEESKSSHVESIKVEKPEAAAIEAGEKPREQSEIFEQVEKTYEEVDTKERVEGDTDKDTGISAEKVENTSFLKDKEEEPSVIRISDEVQTNQEALTYLKEDEGDFSLPSTVTEKVDAEDKKELSGADVIGELSKEAVVEAGKVAEENEPKTLETEEGNGKRNVIPEESTPPVIEKDVGSSISTAEFIEKSFEGKSTGRDVEEQNKGEQNVKDETLALGGTNKDEHVEENQAQATTVVSKPLEEPQESELQIRNEETAETGEDKLEKEKVDEIAKSDVQNLEPSVDAGDETKTSQDLPKELPAKSAQKHSNNIISKVKQSLVKAKKAIIGKSPSSKTLSSETKGDIKVK